MCSIPCAYSVVLYASYSKIPDSSPQWYRTMRSAVLLGLANETMFLSISSLSRIGLQSLPKGKHERSPTAKRDVPSRWVIAVPHPQAQSPSGILPRHPSVERYIVELAPSGCQPFTLVDSGTCSTFLVLARGSPTRCEQAIPARTTVWPFSRYGRDLA